MERDSLPPAFVAASQDLMVKQFGGEVGSPFKSRKLIFVLSSLAVTMIIFLAALFQGASGEVLGGILIFEGTLGSAFLGGQTIIDSSKNGAMAKVITAVTSTMQKPE